MFILIAALHIELILVYRLIIKILTASSKIEDGLRVHIHRLTRQEPIKVALRKFDCANNKQPGVKLQFEI